MARRRRKHFDKAWEEEARKEHGEFRRLCPASSPNHTTRVGKTSNQQKHHVPVSKSGKYLAMLRSNEAPTISATSHANSRPSRPAAASLNSGIFRPASFNSNSRLGSPSTRRVSGDFRFKRDGQHATGPRCCSHLARRGRGACHVCAASPAQSSVRGMRARTSGRDFAQSVEESNRTKSVAARRCRGAAPGALFVVSAARRPVEARDLAIRGGAWRLFWNGRSIWSRHVRPGFINIRALSQRSWKRAVPPAPRAAQIGRHRIKVCQDQPDLGRELGLNLSILGQKTWPSLPATVPNSSDSGPNLADPGPMLIEIGRDCPKHGQIWTELGRFRPVSGQLRLNLTRIRSNLGDSNRFAAHGLPGMQKPKSFQRKRWEEHFQSVGARSG